MIGLVTVALAGPWQGTSAVLPAGEVEVRLPTGRSAVGLGGGRQVWLAPFDVGMGGPRLGLRQRVGGFAFDGSFGVKHTLHRASVKLEGAHTWTLGDHEVSTAVGLDARFLRTTHVDAERTDTVRFDRLQATGTLTWVAWNRLVSRVRLPVLDRGKSLRYGSGSVAVRAERGRVRAQAGVGMMVGRPKDQWTLGTYHWWFWLPYPEVDVAVVF